jgi:hypothetical protein
MDANTGVKLTTKEHVARALPLLNANRLARPGARCVCGGHGFLRVPGGRGYVFDRWCKCALGKRLAAQAEAEYEERERVRRGGGGAKRGPDPELRFVQLRATYFRQKRRLDEIEASLRDKYHITWNQTVFDYQISATERKRRAAAIDAMVAAAERFLDHVQAISPRYWRAGVPAQWVYEELTYADAVRPKDERLSVIPPLAYGSTHHMT